MLTVGLTEAKRRFEKLVERAEQGQRIKITRYGKLKAEITPASGNRRKLSATEKPNQRSRRKPSRKPSK
jgi:prevent-host-death family protein